MKYITLIIEYPVQHRVYVQADLVSAIEKNSINENSRGSIVHVGSTTFQVVEEPLEIVNLLISANAA